MVDALPNDAGYVLVAPARIVPAAPAPLASIRERVAEDWIDQPGQSSARQGRRRARSPPRLRAACPLAKAVAEAGVPLPPVRPVAARRIQICPNLAITFPPRCACCSRSAPARAGWSPTRSSAASSIVKVNSIVPGNALAQPGLIAAIQSEFQQAMSEEYARQFLAAVREEIGVQAQRGRDRSGQEAD